MSERILPRPDGEGLTLAIVIAVALVLFVMPLALLARAGLTLDGAVTLQPILDALDSRSVPRALINSLDSAFFSGLIALVLGTMIALVIVVALIGAYLYQEIAQGLQRDRIARAHDLIYREVLSAARGHETHSAAKELALDSEGAAR